MVSTTTLKQIGALTLSDFESHPVWASCHSFDYGEPWYGQTDEETFRPWLDGLPVDPRDGTFLVRASCVSADGTLFPGFLTPQINLKEQADVDLGVMQPMLLLASGRQVRFWFGMMPVTPEVCEEIYSALGKSSHQMFPVTISAEKGLSKGCVARKLDGFYSISDGKTVRVRR